MTLRVLTVGADAGIGGVGAYVAHIISAAGHTGIEHHMTVSDRSAAQQDARFARAVLHQTPIRYQIRNFASHVARLRRIIVRNGVNVLHLHTARAGWLGCVAARGLSCGLVYTGHGWRFEQKQSAVERYSFWLLERRICQWAHVVACLSKRDLEFGLRQRVLSDKRAVVVATRIPVEWFAAKQPDSTAQVAGNSERHVVVGMVGVADARKDPVTFLEAAALVLKRIPRARFVWVGGGPMRDESVARARALGLGEVFVMTGTVQSNAVKEYLDSFDVLLCPSRAEGVPLAVIEAQARMCPVVCAAYPGVEEVIEQGVNGLLFKPGDAPAAADQVVRILKRSDERHALISAAYQRAQSERADTARMVREYERLYAYAFQRRNH